MNKKVQRKKKVRVSKVERAVIYLAGMLERYDHDQYRLRAHVLDILGLEDDPQSK